MRFLASERWRRIADFAIPWGVGIWLALVALDESMPPTSGPPQTAALVLAVALGVAMRWRRTHPEAVMAIAVLGGFGYWALVPEGVLPIAGLFAIGSLAANRPPRISLIGLAGLEALAAANFLTVSTDDATFTMAVAVGAWALGEAARNRRVAIREEARRAVGEEQARIARELHDVIAHSVSVIVVQAGAADDVFETRPDQARSALRSIERSGREAQRELRRLLSAVRPGEGEDPRAPQPGLEQVDALAERLRASGLEVAVRREGEVPEVPAGVDLSAYRIVQEALTNTLRHARATRADVSLRYGDDAIEVEVRDDGRGEAAGGDGDGHGIVGMRERASLLGGTLEAGPLPGGGYRVRARLPLEEAP
jgi:signal transduction histidine kinase